jgi:hypothetical protein
MAKQALRSMGVDPYAPMPRQVPLVPFTPVPYFRPEDVSLLALRTHLASHPDPVSAVTQFLQQPGAGPVWRKVVSTLSPQDFGDVVGSVPQDHRQSPVAEKLVPLVHNFSCHHLLEALKQAHCSGVRHRMLSTLTGYCVDVKKNKHRVKAELHSDNEEAFFNAGIRYGRRCG